MADNETIKLDKAEGVARITFARPKHNVFNIGMMKQFCSVLEDVSQDAGLKCVVIYGEGASWCAGVDVGDHKPDMAPDMIATFNRSLTLIANLEVPSIAAVQGACLGGGMEYAIACDVVIASQKAKFGQPEVKLGFLPPYAAIRLPLLVGPAKAIEICTSGKIYSADEAQALGFVSQSIEDDAFTEAVVRFIHEIKASSPLILRLNKRAVNQHLGMRAGDALEGVSDLFLNTLMKTEDTLEGIASFYEKRKPDWKNC
ncbi:MAG: enoyl-CoA hydratase/isomerase family protein [Deltaproteobacteria bacterium]|nr:enoyl-CoA hydratase/isomerase family protein [Deltaproteobacteria bacterium]MBW2633588.1 enoyl-CoA hydratase/isomerase family protein [Deltaproteobacteria bacterium]